MSESTTIEPRHDDTGKLITVHDVLKHVGTQGVLLVIRGDSYAVA